MDIWFDLNLGSIYTSEEIDDDGEEYARTTYDPQYTESCRLTDFRMSKITEKHREELHLMLDRAIDTINHNKKVHEVFGDK